MYRTASVCVVLSTVDLTLCNWADGELKRPIPKTRVQEMLIKSIVRKSAADTGAQLNIIDEGTLHKMGIDEKTRQDPEST